MTIPRLLTEENMLGKDIDKMMKMTLWNKGLRSNELKG